MGRLPQPGAADRPDRRGRAGRGRRRQADRIIVPVFLASTNPSDLTVQTGSPSYSGLPAFTQTLIHLPYVRRAGIAVEPIGDVLGRDGGPTAASRASGFSAAIVGSVNGLYFSQDRVTVIRGRMADPRSLDQAVMTAQEARQLGLSVGATVPMGFYTNAQSTSPLFGTPRLRPVVRMTVRIVGLVTFNSMVVQDDIDRPQGYLLLTPALTRVLIAAGTVAALGLTLVASVRRRRRDLAVLKAIGCTRRQLAATVAWQATVAAIVGIAVGVPVGIALGRWLWTLFARQIYAVPEPTVPVGSVIIVSLGTLVLVNLVAALPGRAAARTAAAVALRTELPPSSEIGHPAHEDTMKPGFGGLDARLP